VPLVISRILKTAVADYNKYHFSVFFFEKKLLHKIKRLQEYISLAQKLE